MISGQLDETGVQPAAASPVHTGLHTVRRYAAAATPLGDAVAPRRSTLGPVSAAEAARAAKRASCPGARAGSTHSGAAEWRSQVAPWAGVWRRRADEEHSRPARRNLRPGPLHLLRQEAPAPLCTTRTGRSRRHTGRSGGSPLRHGTGRRLRRPAVGLRELPRTILRVHPRDRPDRVPLRLGQGPGQGTQGAVAGGFAYTHSTAGHPARSVPAQAGRLRRRPSTQQFTARTTLAGLLSLLNPLATVVTTEAPSSFWRRAGLRVRRTGQRLVNRATARARLIPTRPPQQTITAIVPS